MGGPCPCFSPRSLSLAVRPIPKNYAVGISSSLEIGSAFVPGRPGAPRPLSGSFVSLLLGLLLSSVSCVCAYALFLFLLSRFWFLSFDFSIFFFPPSHPVALPHPLGSHLMLEAAFVFHRCGFRRACRLRRENPIYRAGVIRLVRSRLRRLFRRPTGFRSIIARRLVQSEELE